MGARVSRHFVLRTVSEWPESGYLNQGLKFYDFLQAAALGALPATRRPRAQSPPLAAGLYGAPPRGEESFGARANAFDKHTRLLFCAPFYIHQPSASRRHLRLGLVRGGRPPPRAGPAGRGRGGCPRPHPACMRWPGIYFKKSYEPAPRRFIINNCIHINSTMSCYTTLYYTILY